MQFERVGVVVKRKGGGICEMVIKLVLMRGGAAGGLRAKRQINGWEKDSEINIHLSRVFDFRPLTFGSFAAFPEIRRFAAKHTHILGTIFFLVLFTFKTLMLVNKWFLFWRTEHFSDFIHKKNIQRFGTYRLQNRLIFLECFNCIGICFQMIF